MVRNFDVALRLDDGAAAVATNIEIPFYAAWLAAPGAEVPVCVDPSDPAKAVVDWAAAASEPERTPGMLGDPPPAGSAAELLG
jgi:predicted secreted protein